MPRTHILRELTGKGLRLDLPAPIDRYGRVVDQTKKKDEPKTPVVALRELIEKEKPVEDFEKLELQQLELREDLSDDTDDDIVSTEEIVVSKVETHQMMPEKSTTPKTKKKSKKGKSSKKGNKKSKKD